jgi:hypothetical protein
MVNNVRLVLAQEEAVSETTSALHEEVTASILIIQGLEIEEQQ